MDKRKILGTIIGLLMYSALTIFLTYAWYEWKSTNTNVVFTIEDGNNSVCELGPNVNVENIGPILDYNDGVSTTFQIENIGDTETSFSLQLNITSISNSLFSKSFKYILLKGDYAGNNYEETNITGNFQDFQIGPNTISNSISIEAESSNTYKLIVYIDGNEYNNPDMMQSNMNAELYIGNCGEMGVVANGIPITLVSNESTEVIYVVPDIGFFSDMNTTNQINSVTVPTTYGKTFSGYPGLTDENGNITTNASSFNEKTTINANFQPKLITINYNSNGGTGTMTDSTYNYEDSTTLTANTFTKLGYSFDGWTAKYNNKYYGCASGTTCNDDNDTLGWYSSSELSLYYIFQDQANFNLKVDGGTIYLYTKWKLEPIAINNIPTITMTQSQAKQYYGQVVKTVNGTTFDPNSSDSRTWRVFYIDTENKYGDGKGTIYLKADEVSTKTTRFSTTTEDTSTFNFSSTFNILSTTRYYKISNNNIVDSSGTTINTLYLQLNPTYAIGRKQISSTNLYEHEKSAAYLCDPTQFTAYSDSRTNYAIGSPPIEMWIDSWNQIYGNNYLFYYQYNVNVDGTTAVQKLPGYQIKLNDDSWDQAAGLDVIDINTIDTIGMYKTSIGLWTASPAIVYGGNSLIRISPDGFIGNATINMLYGFSPVVSLNQESFVITTSYE